MMRISKLVPAAFVIAGALVLGEAALRPAQQAHADEWQFFVTPQQAYCEGCCGGGNLICCSLPQKCRHEIG